MEGVSHGFGVHGGALELHPAPRQRARRLRIRPFPGRAAPGLHRRAGRGDRHADHRDPRAGRRAAGALMPATTVLWDIDGTLLRSGAVAPVAFLDAVEEVTGVRPTPGGRDSGGGPDTEIAEMLLAAVGAEMAHVADVLEALRRLVFERLQDLRAQTRTFAGVDSLLARLAAGGVRAEVR